MEPETQDQSEKEPTWSQPCHDVESFPEITSSLLATYQAKISIVPTSQRKGFYSVWLRLLGRHDHDPIKLPPGGLN